MEILNTIAIDGKTINIGDNFNIGEEYLLYINEIFEIDGTAYLATSTNKDIIKYQTQLGEEIVVNRNIVPAELFIKQNTHLFIG